ncbi:hypothetical protein DRN98_04520 [Methanosarcinales archaeon]|nr:MAG: hypothetical protein DRN98_04520 [Methanosarcinales archaeon]
MKMKKMLKCLVLPIIVLGVSLMAFGEEDPNANWTGAVNNDWHTAGNWNPTGVPALRNPVKIGDPNYADPPTNYTYPIQVDIDAPADANSLIIGAGINIAEQSTVTISATGSLTTVQNLEIGSDSTGILEVESGAPLTVGGKIILGDDGDGTLSALASSVITIGDGLDVGDNGDGTFTMTGGQLLVTNNIEVSRDNDGSGTMDLDSVNVTCIDFNVASNSDDGDGSGVGSVILTDPNIFASDDLRVGLNGTGTLTSTGGFIGVNDDVEIGGADSSGWSGTVTLNSSDITDPTNLDGGFRFDDLDIGRGHNGYGELIMNGTSRVLSGDDTCVGGSSYNGNSDEGRLGKGVLRMNDDSYLYSHDQMRIGGDSGAVGEVYINDPNVILETKSGEDLFVGKYGTGTLDMDGGTVIVGDDMYLGSNIGASGSASGTLKMNNGAFVDCDDAFDCANDGDATNVTSINMKGASKFYAGSRGKLGHHGSSDIILDGDGTVLGFGVNSSGGYSGSNKDCYFAKNADATGLLKLTSGAELKTNGRWFVATDGGNATIEIDGTKSQFNMDEDLYLGGNAKNEDGDLYAGGGSASLTVTNGGTTSSDVNVNIGDDLHMGGGNSTATIDLVKGRIEVDDVILPRDALGVSAIITLGIDADGIPADDARLDLGGELDASNAGDNDYIDFLGGGRLVIQANKITEQEIQDHIVSGFFRTTYSQPELNGEAPSDPNCFRPVYSSASGGTKWIIELGIGSKCVDPPEYDLDGDCDVDLVDLNLLLEDWLNPADLEDFAGLAAEWGIHGGWVYGQP